MINRSARISAKQRNTLAKCFALDMDATHAAAMAKVSRPCANRWYRHYRELIYQSTRRAPRFFGEIEMDQSEFGGRGRKRMAALLKRYAKIMPHSEYQEKAKQIRKEHKVTAFGILQRGGNVYVHIVKRVDRATLQPIVRLVAEQGSTIYTDKWRAFDELGLDGYTHHNINHSEEYVDKKGNHINGIESFWSFAKRRLAKFNGIARTTLPLHVKECEWRFNARDAAAELKALLRAHEAPESGKGTSAYRSKRSAAPRSTPAPKKASLPIHRTDRKGTSPQEE